MLKKSVAKDLKAIPASVAAEIMQRVAELAVDPRPDGCERLSEKERYRLRIGQYRVVYEIAIDDTNLVTVMLVNGGQKVH
ncbi:MAG: type II toxin-antitoxin system RelE/ParE family toxin [Xanthomonadaceae bacterium]|nr:type II toxin-antitoxin system RelE/ParE family toxin [Xanthomonadaceae bacterium]